MKSPMMMERLLAQPWAMAEEQLAILPAMLRGELEPRAAAAQAALRGYHARSNSASGEGERMATSWKLLQWDEEEQTVKRDFYPTQVGYEVFNYEGLIASLRGTLPVVRPGVSVLLLWGILGRGWSEGERYWMDAIETDEIAQVMARVPAGNEVVLWFRSPGGVVTGLPEASEALRAAANGRKVSAFTDEMCASAAYMLAAQCGEIVATPTAQVGSIGVYNLHYDQTEWMKKLGVELHLWKAGKYKADGVLGNPVSAGMSKRMQEWVDECYEIFTRMVTEMRALESETMQGQCFRGEEAVGRNLVDRLVSGAGEFLG